MDLHINHSIVFVHTHDWLINWTRRLESESLFRLNQDSRMRCFYPGGVKYSWLLLQLALCRVGTALSVPRLLGSSSGRFPTYSITTQAQPKCHTIFTPKHPRVQTPHCCHHCTTKKLNTPIPTLIFWSDNFNPNPSNAPVTSHSENRYQSLHVMILVARNYSSRNAIVRE
jgi:hypothetical protein